ncbi:MAG: SsrA-binding protein SmpB [Rickettsiales bacterium]
MQKNNLIAHNKKANFNYNIQETFEAGIVLKGQEVKAIRTFGMNIEESYIIIKNLEAFLINSNIKQMQTTSFNSYEAKRVRKLLLNKKQILNLFAKSKLSGQTIIPISVYFNERSGFVKLNIGLASGKKIYDKRKSIAQKEWNRQKIRLNHEKNKV